MSEEEIYTYPKNKNLRWKIAQFFELKWWQYYLGKQSSYNYYKWKKNYWTSLLDRIKPPLTINKSAKILDAGCGPAGIFTVFPHHSVTAIDPLLNNYQQKIAMFQPSHFPHTQFINTSIETLSLSKTFSHIFCMNALNHVNNISNALSRLIDHLQSPGYLIISIDCHNYNWVKLLFRMIPADILHPHQYSLYEYKSLFNTNNLKIKKLQCIRSHFLFNHYLFVLQKGDDC